jgi:hypothetical protein
MHPTSERQKSGTKAAQANPKNNILLIGFVSLLCRFMLLTSGPKIARHGPKLVQDATQWLLNDPR